jgi:shikimate kinase
MSVEDNLVIACGGGFIENELNIQYFKERPNKVVCVYLSAEVDTLAFRSYEKIKMKNSKVPLDQIRTSIEKIYAKRDLLYRTYSDIVINTDFTEVYKAANDLTELVKKQEAILSIQ